MFKTFQSRFLLIWILGICLYIPMMNNLSAWFDEQYSLYLTSLPWSDMLSQIIREDGHPPLHPIILRLWNTGHNFHDVGWARLLSLTLLAGTALIGAFPVRRLCGDKIALWFTALVFLLPRALFLGTDMRMYGMLNLEITAMVVYGLLALKGGRTSDWIKFTIFSILAMYTHYFGVLTLAVLNIFLFFALIQKRISLKRQMCFLFGCASVCGLAFLPWFLCVFLRQATRMYSDWYPTVESLENTYTTFIKPSFEVLPLPVLVIVALFSSLMWLLLIQAATDKKQAGRQLIVCVLTVFMGVLCIATLFSLTIRPMMSWRYLMPYAGILALGISTIMAQEKRFKKLFLVLLVAAFALLYIPRYKSVHDPFYQVLPSIIREQYAPEESVFLCNEGGTALFMEFYLPEYQHYLVPKKQELMIAPELMKPLKEIPADFNNKKILVFWRYNSKDEAICTPPLQNRYDHFANWCLGEITPDQAAEFIEKGATLLPEYP